MIGITITPVTVEGDSHQYRERQVALGEIGELCSTFVPPGMQAMIKTPTAMAGGSGSSVMRRKPRNGMIPYCDTTPIIRP